MLRHLFFIVFALGIFGGCSTLPDGPKRSVNLPAQLAALTQVTQWELSGKMAIRNGKEATSASVIWKTDGDDFGFRLTNMLGITLADLHVDQHGAVLEADGERYVDRDAEQLIEAVTGLTIPVVHLQSWVKGLPREQDTYTLNTSGLVDTLMPQCADCLGWHVAFNNYGRPKEGKTDVWLPHSITLTQTGQPGIKIKIRIYEWTIK